MRRRCDDSPPRILMRLCHLAPAAVVAALVSPVHAARPVAGSATPDRLKLPAGPSSVRGLAAHPAVVPFSAQLQYEVPIGLPVGHGGLAPPLRLVYWGALGNGPLGIGWSLGEIAI